jgi:hypothetical protein
MVRINLSTRQVLNTWSQSGSSPSTTFNIGCNADNTQVLCGASGSLTLLRVMNTTTGTTITTFTTAQAVAGFVSVPLQPDMIILVMSTQFALFNLTTYTIAQTYLASGYTGLATGSTFSRTTANVVPVFDNAGRYVYFGAVYTSGVGVLKLDSWNGYAEVARLAAGVITTTNIPSSGVVYPGDQIGAFATNPSNGVVTIVKLNLTDMTLLLMGSSQTDSSSFIVSDPINEYLYSNENVRVNNRTSLAQVGSLAVTGMTTQNTFRFPLSERILRVSTAVYAMVRRIRVCVLPASMARSANYHRVTTPRRQPVAIAASVPYHK